MAKKNIVLDGDYLSGTDWLIENQEKNNSKFEKSYKQTLSNPPFQIRKADEDKRLVFGWALVSATKDGKQIIDHQGDIVEQDELEEAAYEYVLNFRDAGEEHIPGLRKKGRLVESVVFTEEKLQAMGIPFGTVPYGWWIGFYVDDDKTWELIKNGTYKMFSIEGKAVREPVEDPVKKADGAERMEKVLEERTLAKTFNEILKFNPYHDSRGRFATANSHTMFTIRTKDPKKQHMADMAIARERERAASASSADTKPKVTTKPQKEKVSDPMYPKSLAGVERGKPMNFDEANHGTTNPNYGKSHGYSINCQTCVVANEARRRGYDVSARPKDTKEADALAHDTRLAWKDPKTGKKPEFMEGSKDIKTAKQARKFLDDNLKEGERYTIEWAWKGRGRSGHIINAFKDSDGVKLYDPQNGKIYKGNEVDTLLSRVKYTSTLRGYGKFTHGLKTLRIDNLQFNTEMVDKILAKGAA